MNTTLKPEEVYFQLIGQSQEKREKLVLIHGLDSASATFNNLFPSLDQYQLLAYDARGHGQTPHRGLDYSNKVMSDDLENLLDMLGIKEAHILGHSMGARTAVQFAHDHPERVKSLIIEDMEVKARGSMSEKKIERMLKEHDYLNKIFAQRDYKDAETLTKLLGRIYGKELTKSLIGRRTMTLQDGRERLMFRPQVQSLYARQANVQSLSQEFAELEAPTLVLKAKNISAISKSGYKEMKELRPDAQFVKIDAGHTIHRDNEEAFLNCLLEFWNQPHAVLQNNH